VGTAESRSDSRLGLSRVVVHESMERESHNEVERLVGDLIARQGAIQEGHEFW
jgi:hypothetical protein